MGENVLDDRAPLGEPFVGSDLSQIIARPARNIDLGQQRADPRPHFWRSEGAMTVKSWIWRSMIAGLAGSAVHLSFMYLKSRTGLLPAFQPYQSYRAMLGHWRRCSRHRAVSAFIVERHDHSGIPLCPPQPAVARPNQRREGMFAAIGWVFMGLVFFPVIGLRPFAVRA